MSHRIDRVTGTAVPVMGDDIDTDRIIPARFLKLLSFRDLAPYAFYDVRFDPDTGEPTGHPIDEPRFEGASVLISGRNFGCGSSREHAPQSLYRAGLRAIVAESFAEIFFGNSLALGLPCVTLPREALERLAATVDEAPDTPVTIDIATRELRAGDLTSEIGIPRATRSALLEGQWDPLELLRRGADTVRAVYDGLPYATW